MFLFGVEGNYTLFFSFGGYSNQVCRVSSCRKGSRFLASSTFALIGSLSLTSLKTILTTNQKLNQTSRKERETSSLPRFFGKMDSLFRRARVFHAAVSSVVASWSSSEAPSPLFLLPFFSFSLKPWPNGGLVLYWFFLCRMDTHKTPSHSIYISFKP